jgi:hypothetical protein
VRFEIKTKENSWVCAACQDGGDVIRLLQRVEGLGFLEAIERLGGARQADPETTAQRERERADKEKEREQTSDKYRQRERGSLYQIWTRAIQPWGTPVEEYLALRGLPIPPWPQGTARLRYVANMPYFHGEETDATGHRQPRVIHRGPAMVAPIVREGKFSGLQFTYLDLTRPNGKAAIFDPDTGEVLKVKKTRGSAKGGAIELIKVIPPNEPEQAVIGEGVETTLTVWHAMRSCDIDLARTEFLASAGFGNLGGVALAQVVHPTLSDARGRARRVPGPDPDLSTPGIVLPESVREAILLGDGDSDRVTTECAIHRGAARFRETRTGYRVVRAAWADDGMDFNDMLRGVAMPGQSPNL